MTIKMMAIRITRETYPIAVACLTPQFSTLTMDNVLKGVLIINVPATATAVDTTPRRRRPYTDECEVRNEMSSEKLVVALHNIWRHKKTFRDYYRVVEKDEKINGDYFVEVESYRK